jgi:hypothetical protein
MAIHWEARRANRVIYSIAEQPLFSGLGDIALPQRKYFSPSVGFATVILNFDGSGRITGNPEVTHNLVRSPSCLSAQRDRLFCNAACFEMAASDSILT